MVKKVLINYLQSIVQAPIITGHYAALDTWDLSPDFPSKDYPDSVSFARSIRKK